MKSPQPNHRSVRRSFSGALILTCLASLGGTAPAQPVATIVVEDTALRIGETSPVIFTFSEAVVDFTNGDLSVANGTLSTVSSSDGGLTWTATLTPAANVTDSTNLITLDHSGIADTSGNHGSGTTDSNNYAIDTTRPAATIVVADTAIKIGESITATLTFSEAVTGFTKSDLTAGNATVNLVSSSDGGVTWTTRITPTAGVTDATNVVTLDNTGYTDLAGNTGIGTTDSNNYAMDTDPPEAITINRLDPSPTKAETVRYSVTFSEPVIGLDIGDIGWISGWEGPGGFLSRKVQSVSMVNPTTYWVTFGGIQGDGFFNMFVKTGDGVTDEAGNPLSSSVNGAFYSVDRVAPTATVTMADSALSVGESSLLTITFNEKVFGFTNSDLTVPNGGLSPVGSSDGGITWTAIFTPATNVTQSTNVMALDLTGVTDDIGNAGVGVSTSNNFAIDTKPPSLQKLVRFHPSPTNWENVRFFLHFNEGVTGVDASDFTLVSTGTAAGSIAGVTRLDDFAYYVEIQSITGEGTLGLNLKSSGTGIQDAAGNPVSGGFTGETYVVDRVAPVVTSVSVPSNAIYTLGQNMDFTVSFSENVSVPRNGGNPRIPITFDHGGMGYAQHLSGDGTRTLVFRASVLSGQADSTGITLDGAIDFHGGRITDDVGNDALPDLHAVASTTGVLVDAVPPVVENGGIPDQTLKVGGPSKTILLSSYFSDIGSVSMTYSASSNNGASKATITGNQLTISPIANGITQVTVQADDGHGGTTADTFEIAVGTTLPTTRRVGGSGTLNSQNGLFDLTVNVTNTTPRPINGFRLHVNFDAYKKAYPSLRLYNASSPPNSPDVFVDYPFPVAVDKVVSMNLSFYTSTRIFPSPFKPKLSVETLAASQLPGSKGHGVQPRMVRMRDGTVMLEFDSVVGRWYRVSFSNDLVNWHDSPVPIQAGSTRMQWIDSGPPFTDVPPNQSRTRFYLVNRIKAP